MKVVPDEGTIRGLYRAIEKLTSTVNINSIEIEGIIPNDLYYVPIQALRFWLDFWGNCGKLEAIKAAKEWCVINLPFNDPVPILLFRTDV